MVYSLLESKLKKVCDILKKETNVKLELSDFNGRDYSGTYKIFLEKVIGLDITLLEIHEPKLKNLQQLRNILVHEMGTVERKDEKKINAIIEQSEKKLILEDVDQKLLIRIVDETYLYILSKTLRIYFRDLLWVIDKYKNHELLKKRIAFTFSFADNNMQFETFIVTETSTKGDPAQKSRTIATKAIINDSGERYTVTMEIVMKYSTEDVLKVHLDKSLRSHSLLARNCSQLSKEWLLRNIFSVFYMNNNMGRKMEISITP